MKASGEMCFRLIEHYLINAPVFFLGIYGRLYVQYVRKKISEVSCLDRTVVGVFGLAVRKNKHRAADVLLASPFAAYFSDRFFLSCFSFCNEILYIEGWDLKQQYEYSNEESFDQQFVFCPEALQ